MRKLLAVLLIACFLLTASAVGFAAPAVTPFSDVPANHWAYAAIAQLQKDGIVTGETPTTFVGNRTLTRYEAAVMLSGVMRKLSAGGTSAMDNLSKQDRTLVQRLAAEFAAELDAMGVKVDTLQAQVTGIQAQIDRMPKFSFQSQVQIDPNTTPRLDGTTHVWDTVTTPNTLMFIQPQISGNIDGNWKYYAEVRFIAPLLEGPASANPTSGTYATTYFDNRSIIDTQIRSAYVYGNALGATWYAGRMEDNLPFTNTLGRGGLVTDSRLDGVRMAMQSGNFKADIFAGADINGVTTRYASGIQGSQPSPSFADQAFISGLDMGYQFGAANVSLGWYQGWGGQTPSTYNYNPFENVAAPAQFIEVGAGYQITPLISLTAFAASNANAYPVVGQATTAMPGGYPVADISMGSQQNLSWLGRIDFGTYNSAVKGSMNVYGLYASTGANSVWTSPNYDVSTLGWGGRNFQGSEGLDSFGMNGNAQGLEIGMDWAPATNMDWHLSWSYTTAIDGQLASAQSGASPTSAALYPMNVPRNIYKSEFTVFF
ncbi:MAG: S-layer homology domain-containing protein [Negativicutes bacterium]|jgi:hypothetical protein